MVWVRPWVSPQALGLLYPTGIRRYKKPVRRR